ARARRTTGPGSRDTRRRGPPGRPLAGNTRRCRARVPWRQLATLARAYARRMARLVGINHVALEVGDIDAALEWYGALFEFHLRGRSGKNMAFIDMGDQFLALSAPRRHAARDDRHFGLVVDDKEAVRAALVDAGAQIVPTR